MWMPKPAAPPPKTKKTLLDLTMESTPSKDSPATSTSNTPSNAPTTSKVLTETPKPETTKSPDSGKNSAFSKMFNKDKKEETPKDSPKSSPSKKGLNTEKKSDKEVEQKKSDKKETQKNEDDKKPEKKGFFKNMFGKDKKDQEKPQDQKMSPDNKPETQGQQIPKESVASPDSKNDIVGSEVNANKKDAKSDDVPKIQEDVKPGPSISKAVENSTPQQKPEEVQPKINEVQQKPNEPEPKPQEQLQKPQEQQQKPQVEEIKKPVEKEKKPEKKGFFGKLFGKDSEEENLKEDGNKKEEKVKETEEDKNPGEAVTEQKENADKKSDPEKSGGFFSGVGKLFGKEEEKLEDGEKNKANEKEETKDKDKINEEDKKEKEKKSGSEKSGGFFSGVNKLFGKDEEKVKSEEDKKAEVKKPDEDGFFSGVNKFFKKDENESSKKKDGDDLGKHEKEGKGILSGKDDDKAAEGSKEEHQKGVKVVKEPSDDDDDDDDDVIDVEEELKEQTLKPLKEKKRKKKKKVVADIEDEFESGDACLVKLLDVPFQKRLVLNPKLGDRYGGLLANCERVLGVVPGKFVDHHERKHDPDAIRGIYVWGIVPNGPADKAGVEIGDWIVSINDIEVNSKNFHDVIRDTESQDKAKLKLQKLLLNCESSSPLKKSADLGCPKYPAMVSNLSGGGSTQGESLMEVFPHGVMFLKKHMLSRELQELDAKEDVIYYFPSALNETLLNYRGSFLSLHSLIPFISGQSVDSTTLEFNNKAIRVLYQTFSNGLLLICLPANKCSESQVGSCMKDIVRLIELQLQSVENAFHNHSNHAYLDDLFASAFLTIISPDDLTWSDKLNWSMFREEFFDSSMHVRSVTVNLDVKMQVDEQLNSLEAGCLGNLSEDYYGSRKIFDIIGSAYYYRGYSISNHLPFTYTTDVHLLLKYNGLLSKGDFEHLRQSYRWMEVFFHPAKMKKPDLFLSKNIKNFDGTNLMYDRYFVLALSAYNSVLVTILGCNEKSSDLIGQNPTVDLFLLNQMKFTLSQLSLTGTIDAIDYCLREGAQPHLASAEWFLKKPSSKLTERLKKFFKRNKEEQKVIYSTNQNIEKLQATPTAGEKSFLKRQMSDSTLYLKAQFEKASNFDEDEDDDMSEFGRERRNRRSSGSSAGMVPSFSASKLQLHSMSSYLKASSQQLQIKAEPIDKLNSGQVNAVFNYAYIDPSQNIILTPPQQQVISHSSMTHVEVMNKFHQSCVIIHELFEKSQTSNSEPVLEHGVLFTCSRINYIGSNKTSDQQVAYWVVGRLLDSSDSGRNNNSKKSELYVCFHDSAQQNVVEMAFKLLNGLYCF